MTTPLMKVANLTGALLSRKGLARPTATATTDARTIPENAPIEPPRNAAWLTLAPLHPRAARRAAAKSRAATVATRAEDRNRRVHVSLRLERAKHGALKRLAAATHRTQQSLLEEAVDSLLAQHPPHDAAGTRRTPHRHDTT
ncbi:MAG: hypothetical protein D6826_11205 [Alphaproteobacteria bacterium]|nr:MAG: hypothetical protein D6826_11205 [Alphaproteobacteria bacterium]